MNANRIHAQRPSRYTHDDYARMASAVRIAEELRARKARAQRVARLAVFALAVAAPFIFFYSIGSY